VNEEKEFVKMAKKVMPVIMGEPALNAYEDILCFRRTRDI